MNDLRLPSFLPKTSMATGNPIKQTYAIEQCVSLYGQLNGEGQRTFADALDLHPWTTSPQTVREKAEAFLQAGNDLYRLNHDMRQYLERQKSQSTAQSRA